MKNHKEKIQSSEISSPSPALESTDVNLEGISGMGKVKEMAQSSANQKLQDTHSSSGHSSQTKDEDATADEREVLKARLLQNAPHESQLRKEIQQTLHHEKDRLEADIKKHKRGKNYHALSLAIMQLRQVVHQLSDLARMSYEKLKITWLKVVHKFA